MKFTASLALIVIVYFMANSSNALPVRKSMIYYQHPAQYYAAPQRIMYMQYVQPGRTHAHSTQAAAALVAGNNVATGSYLEQTAATIAPAAVDISIESNQGENVLSANGAHVVSSVAEAYPAEVVPNVQIEIENADAGSVVERSDDAVKVPREYSYDAPAITSEAPEVAAKLPTLAAEIPAVPSTVAAELPAVASITTGATPASNYLPPSSQSNRKVIVELDTSADTDEAIAQNDDSENGFNEIEDTDEETALAPLAPIVPRHPARHPAARRPPAGNANATSKRPSRPAQSLSPGTFFPIDFGGTSGGAIAIANSFSTGEGGSATSHAIAYGSPDAARARVRPNRFH